MAGSENNHLEMKRYLDLLEKTWSSTMSVLCCIWITFWGSAFFFSSNFCQFCMSFILLICSLRFLS